MILVYEGANCVGKSHAIRTLIDAAGGHIVHVREQDSPVFQALKPFLGISAEIDIWIYSMTRKFVYDTVTLPYLNAGKTVVYDRLFMTSYVYQEDRDHALLDALHDLMHIESDNDIKYVFIDPSEEVLRKNMASRAAESRGMEKTPEEIERLQRRYRDIIEGRFKDVTKTLKVESRDE